MVYCAARKGCMYSTGDADQAAGKVTYNVCLFKGKEVHTYLAFIANDESKASDSVYTGMVKLPDWIKTFFLIHPGKKTRNYIECFLVTGMSVALSSTMMMSFKTINFFQRVSFLKNGCT
jgi:hypothetical protein